MSNELNSLNSRSESLTITLAFFSKLKLSWRNRHKYEDITNFITELNREVKRSKRFENNT